MFKTVADPFVGKVSYVKVISGKLTADTAVVNARTGEAETPWQTGVCARQKQTDTAEIGCGDIGAVTKCPPRKRATRCVRPAAW